MTLAEINQFIEAMNNREKLELTRNYLLSTQIASFVNIVMSGKDIPSIEEVYPHLYQKESPQAQKDITYLKTMAYKDKMLQYAERYNKWRKKKEAHE